MKFTDEYIATVFETPHPEHDPLLVTDPPTAKTGVVANAICVNNDGSPAEDSVLLYSILDGNSALFSIDEVTGQFSVADVPFDYEEQPWYLVHLFCHNSSAPNNNGIGTVNISIGPLNEFLPTISEFNIIPIPGSTPNGTIIAATDHSLGPLAIYTVTDRDTGADGVIIYALNASRNNSDDRIFKLNGKSGRLTLNTLLDVDNLPLGFQKLEISITVCNVHVPLDICKIADLIVFITAANDIAPVFTEPLYTAPVNESEPNGTVILQAKCMDNDAGVYDKVQSITFADNTPESILNTIELSHELDVSLVNLSLRSELDYETTIEYTFELVCSDGVHTVTAGVHVIVLCVNDEPIIFTQSQYNFTVNRLELPGDVVVGQLEVEDNDVGPQPKVTYSIEDNENFDIDSSGQVLLQDFILIIEGDQFTLSVIASNGEDDDATTVVVVSVDGYFSVLDIVFIIAGVLALTVIVALVSCSCCVVRRRKR